MQSHLSMWLIVLCLCPAALVRADSIHAVPPCRLVDTRETESAAFAPGSSFHFMARVSEDGAPSEDQGGAIGCGVPSAATAVILHVTAVSPSSAGHGKLWAYGSSEPDTSVINVTTSETVNVGTFALLPAPGGFDLSLKNAIASVHWVVDVVGYAAPSEVPGQAVGVLFGHVLVVETLSGQTIKAFASDDYPTFKASWEDSLSAALDNCVVIHGEWYDGNSPGELGLFQANSLPIVLPGFCGPEPD